MKPSTIAAIRTGNNPVSLLWNSVSNYHHLFHWILKDLQANKYTWMGQKKLQV